MEQAKYIEINGRKIGDGYPAYIIAEMSANHSGSIERAKEIIREAKRCGADCIKIQTYTPDTLTIDCHNAYFQVENGTWEGENLYSLYGKAYTPWEWQKELKEEADRVGIDFFSTPFDNTSVDFLENEVGVDFYKIASFELVDIPLLKYVASKGKPIIMSTGMATIEEIKEAIEAIKSQGNEQIAILKCSSAYPAKIEEMNLCTIKDMKQRFHDIPVGLSDHSMGHFSATTAVALGANIIEKHFCISREIENPDASFSMNPQEFTQMVQEIRKVEQALGKVTYGISPQEESSKVFRRSIFVIEDIKKGEYFTDQNTRVIRPGYGEKPKYFEDILGMQAIEDIQRGIPFTFDKVKKGNILFLTNNPDSMKLYDWLCEQEGTDCVSHFSNKLTADIVKALQPQLIISFNYRHLITKEVLELLPNKVINLHTSYLPYNRGSSPNFFSFLDNTPKGVTIHLMDEGLDTGAILCQKEVLFDETQETFASSYAKLQEEIIQLFCENWEELKKGTIAAKEQTEDGTYHKMKELHIFQQKYPFSWSDNIAQMKQKYKLK